MEELRNKVKNLLTESNHSMTIPQIYKNLKIDDEFDVLSAIADLESINEVVMTGMKTFYQSDGCAGYLAEYGCVRCRRVDDKSRAPHDGPPNTPLKAGEHD